MTDYRPIIVNAGERQEISSADRLLCDALYCESTAQIGFDTALAKATFAVGEGETSLANRETQTCKITYTETSGTQIGFGAQISASSTSTSSAVTRGFQAQAGTSSGHSGELTGRIEGCSCQWIVRGDGDVTAARGLVLTSSNTGSGTIATSIGVLVDRQERTSTVSYGIWQGYSDDQNYFNGKIGQGTNSPNCEVSVYDGFISVGGNPAAPSAGDSGVVFGDSADVTPAANSAAIYGHDESGTVELKVVDEAGNITQVTPHPTAVLSSHDAAAASLGLNPVVVPWGYSSENQFAGERYTVDEALGWRMVEELWRRTTGSSHALIQRQTYVPQVTWDAIQQQRQSGQQAKRDHAIAARRKYAAQVRRWLESPGLVERPEPPEGLDDAEYTPKPAPAWLADITG